MIRVHNASLNFPDGLLVTDKYQQRWPTPFTVGQEATGIVSAIGQGVIGLKVGDAIAAFGRGAAAEYMVVDASKTAILPSAASLHEAAAMIVNYGTAYYALHRRAGLSPGDKLLVLGAGGGVGSAAVEIGKLMGAQVAAAASSSGKLGIASICGADHLIDYCATDLRAALRTLNPAFTPDVIFDPVGGSMSEAAFRSIGWGGRFLVVGFAAGTIASMPLNLPLLKGASILGIFWGASQAREPETFAEDFSQLFQWLSQGQLHPIIGGRFPLEQGSHALATIMAGKAEGKLVLDIA